MDTINTMINRPRLTLEEYLKNEDINYHTENALLLVKQYGTEKELKEMIKIFNNHMKRGHILSEEMTKRYKLSNKYFKLLVKESAINDYIQRLLRGNI